MTIRPHRDADAEGIAVITKTRDESSGYAGFTNAELIPHTDGPAESNPPAYCFSPVSKPPTRAEGNGRHRQAERRQADSAKVTLARLAGPHGGWPP
jgi:hypothetical protein